MRKSTLVLLVAGALLFGGFVGTVTAYGTAADCRPGQIGTGPARTGRTDDDRIPNTPLVPVNGRDTGAKACEGEHYDGEDFTGNECQVTQTRILGNPDLTSFLIAYQYGCAPFTPHGDQNGVDRITSPVGALDAVHLRASGKGSEVGCANHGAVFVGLSIFGVGEVAVFGQGDQGVAPTYSPTANCGTVNPSGGGQGTANVYLRDNSNQLFEGLTVSNVPAPVCSVYSTAGGTGTCGNLDDAYDQYVMGKDVCGNWLAGAVHRVGITQGQGVGDVNDPLDPCAPNPDNTADCTYNDYVDGKCYRDDTAIGVMLLA